MLDTKDLGEGIHFLRYKENAINCLYDTKAEFYNFPLDSYFTAYYANRQDAMLGIFSTRIVEIERREFPIDSRFTFFYLMSYTWYRQSYSPDSFNCKFFKGIMLAFRTIEEMYQRLSVNDPDLLRLHELRLEHFQNLLVRADIARLRREKTSEERKINELLYAE